MSLNPTVFTENERSVPGPDQNVFEINRFRKITEPAEPSHSSQESKNTGQKSGAMVIPFDEILKYKERNDAIKRLQERTGLCRQDARDVIETLQNRDIDTCDVKKDHPLPRPKRLIWLCLSLAVAGLIWLF